MEDSTSPNSYHDPSSTPTNATDTALTPAPTRVLVFGTGAIGIVYTLVLSRANVSITSICRSNFTAASTDGFTARSTIFGTAIVKPVAVARSVAEAVEQGFGPWDFVVVCAKAFPGSIPSTAELIRPAVTEGTTTVVLIQNGIAIEDEYAESFPRNPLLSCVVYLPATQVEPGVVVHKEIELLHVGTFPATAPPDHKDAARLFVELMRKGGATVELHDDVQVQRWKKLLVNAAWNPVCALSRCQDAEFLATSDEAIEYIRGLMMEVSKTAQAAGYPMINQKEVDFQIGRAQAREVPGVEPSMLADVRGSRRMEVEAIVGNTVRIARRKGLTVPLLGVLYVLAKALDEKIGKST